MSVVSHRHRLSYFGLIASPSTPLLVAKVFGLIVNQVGERAILSEGKLLSAANVGAYLACRRIIGVAEPVEASEMSGGVSNIVLGVRAGDRALVVKQSLPRLRVQDEWVAKRQRTISEGQALRLAGRLTPGAVPEVLDIDEGAFALIITQAPPEWRNWKVQLLAGEADPLVAKRLGELLAVWHRETWDKSDIASRFADFEAFEQLRVDPYYRTIMDRRPELRQPIGEYVTRMLTTRRCLVHGDYSPKNVLVGHEVLWVVDFEVVHFGDPAFDLAFMLNHLMLKAVHLPSMHHGYALCAQAFWEAYVSELSTVPAPDWEYLLGQVGCLMVSRVDGKSPVEYLTQVQRGTARTLGSELVTNPPGSLSDAWALLMEITVH